MGATTTDELVEAVCALHTRLARECERAAEAPRTQVLGGWAQLGAALDRLTQAAFVAACAERSLAPDPTLRRVTGREAYEVSRAGSGQLARALAALAREAPPRDPTLARIAAEADDKDSPLRRVIAQRNDMLHGRPHAGGDALPSLLGSATRWRLPYAATAAMPRAQVGDAPAAVAGTVLGDRYTLDARLGEGTFGEVWSARDRRLAERPVAVKVLKPEFARDVEAVARFDAEADALAGLAHPNVVTVFDRGAHGMMRYLVTELVEGPTLAAWLAAHRDAGAPPALPLVARLLDQACAGVEAAHAIRRPGAIVHRDLKPDNLLLQSLPDGAFQVKVVDFGVARLAGRARTMTGALLGTPRYMAPEQSEGADRTRPATDVFALGVIAVELLTLRADVGDGQMWWFSLSQRPGVDPRVWLGGVPEGLRDVLATALQPDPDQRFRDASALRRALAGAFASLGATTSTPPAPPSLAPPAPAPPSSAPTPATLPSLVIEPTVFMPTASRPSTEPDRRVTAPPVAVRAPAPGGVSPLRGAMVSVAVFAAAIGGGAAWMRRDEAPSSTKGSTAPTARANTGDGRCVFASRALFHLRSLPWVNSLGEERPGGTRTELLSPLDLRRNNARLYRVRLDDGAEGMAFVDAVDLLTCGRALDLTGTVALARPSHDRVTASSAQPSHPAWHAFDQDPRTAWNEDEPGPGDGTWIEASYATPRRIRRVVLSTGWNFTSARDGDLYAQNSHLARVTVTFDGGHAVTRDVGADTRAIVLDDLAVTARRVHITADRVWPGTRWYDLTLDEIEVHAE